PWLGGRQAVPAPRGASRRRSAECADRSNRQGRQYAARLCRLAGRTRRLPASLLRLRPGRRALPCLQDADSGRAARPTGLVLLPELSEVSVRSAPAFRAVSFPLVRRNAPPRSNGIGCALQPHRGRVEKTLPKQGLP